MGPKTFEGISATEVRALATTSFTGLPVTQTEALNYVGVDASGLVSLSYGGTAPSEMTTGGMPMITNIKTVITPPFRFPYNLGVGESYTQENTYSVSGNSIVMGFETPIPPTSTTSTSKITFNGIEQITVPAGTFSACKFTEEDINPQSGGTVQESVSRTWMAVGSGVPVRNESVGEGGVTNVMALTSGTINGAQIRP